MLLGLLGGVSWSDETKISRNLVHHFFPADLWKSSRKDDMEE